MNLILMIISVSIPLAIMAWAINKKFKLGRVTLVTLMSSVFTGALFQTTDGGHEHIPFSGIWLFLIVNVIVVAFLVVTITIRTLFRKT